MPRLTFPKPKPIKQKNRELEEDEVDERMVVKGKAYTLTASYSKATPSPAQVEHNIEKGQRTMVLSKHQQTNLREVDEKAHTLCSTMHKGSHANGTTLIKVGHVEPNVQGNRVYSTDGKSTSLSADGGGLAGGTTLIKEEARIRKLTPIECERLQGLPDNYTEGVATTNRYKCLGNAFNVDVVAHILLNLHSV